ncbi:hypothetical protein AB0K21_13895 [Streptosporangium sp. NPDC049248]
MWVEILGVVQGVGVIAQAHRLQSESGFGPSTPSTLNVDAFIGC